MSILEDGEFDVQQEERPKWTQDDAIALCRAVELIAPAADCHVALTGGCLYKAQHGPRKDVDLLFYRIRQVESLNKQHLGHLLTELGFTLGTDHGWVWKATYQGKDVDLFFPDHSDGEYHA